MRDGDSRRFAAALLGAHRQRRRQHARGGVACTSAMGFDYTAISADMGLC